MTPPRNRGTGGGNAGRKQGRPGGSGGRPGAPKRGGAGPRNAAVAGPIKPKRPGRPQRVSPVRPDVDVHDPDGIRLQKLLAQAGVGSRRVCEALIEEGRVEVDGQVVVELGVRVDPSRQIVKVDGERVQLDESRVYLAFYKPTNVVTSMSDELGRLDLGAYLKDRPERLFHVGRLDADTEGLLILTNDGELAHRLQHPQYGVQKTYLAQVPGPIPRDLGRRLRDGVQLDDGPAKVDSFRVVDSRPGKAMVEVVLHEGRKHIVRRLLEAVGHPVLTLVRTQVGPVLIGDVKPGKWRTLNSAEVAALYKAAGL